MFSRANKWLIAATGTGIFYALALLIFSFFLFNKDQSTTQTILDLLIHFIPTAIVLFLVVIAHQRPLVGSIIFAINGLVYIITGWANLHWTAHVVIAGPLLVLSMLYIIAYKSIK